MRRYPVTSIRESLYYGTPKAINVVRTLIGRKILKTKDLALREGERLDHVAFEYYGDTRLWWVIAAASDIGWGLQCPPGTYIRIPLDLGMIADAL